MLNFLKFYLPHRSINAICIGNEVFSNLIPNSHENKDAFSTLIEEVCNEIHSKYPDLEVTYAAKKMDPLIFFKTKISCIDYFGTNSYGSISENIKTYIDSNYNKPFLITEYGCLGWWEKDWGNYPDKERAKDYTRHWDILKKHSKGGFAFAWIDKTESGYKGWGIVNNDRTLRPQFTSISTAYEK